MTPAEALQSAWASAWRGITFAALRSLADAHRIDKLCAVVVADRQAFPDDAAGWEFMAKAALHVAAAHRCKLVAAKQARDLRRLREIALSPRVTVRDAREEAAMARLERAFAFSLQPGGARLGRPNETDLRDLVIRLIADSYPRAGRRGVAWRIACQFAQLSWRTLAYSDDLMRDMRRRRAKPASRSRALMEFRASHELVYGAIFRQALEGASASLSGLSLSRP